MENYNILDSTVTEVPAGGTVTLNCTSNDYEHNFLFWILGTNKVIGPGSPYDNKKYKYEVLSGKLHINRVSSADAGMFQCISKKLGDSGFSVGEVEMVVKGSIFSTMDAVKLVAIVISIIVIVTCAVMYFRLRKEWSKYGQTVIQVDDDDDDEDGDEIYNPTTTAISTTISQSAAGPSKIPSKAPSRNPSSELLYGIDNQGLDTDFNSVFENIQIKSPLDSLI